MKRRKKTEFGSLDSLLDTMTNVVGILVIVLVVTQLGVRDAVSRISQSEQVSPEAVARAQHDLDELSAQRDRAKATVISLTSDRPRDERALLERRIVSLRPQVGSVSHRHQQEQQQAAARLATARRRVIAAEARTKQLLAEVLKLEKELNIEEGRLEKLRAQLAVIPLPTKTAAKEILLPNPRSAPEGATPFTMLCRDGRVIPVDAVGLQQRAQKRASYIVSRRKLDANKAKGIDGKLFVKHFNETAKIRDAYFDVELTVHGRYPKLVLTRRKNAGETATELAGRTASYRQLIRRIPVRKHYLRFIVWSDSYEVYIHARRLATERGLMAGWSPTSAKGEYVISLGGPIRVGPPPKPRPKPVDPPPKPVPPPKPKPVDTID